MSSRNTSKDQVKHSDPIAINTRGRSFSISSGSSSGSESSASEDVHTPSPTSTNSQRITIPSPSGSPILSYFLGQSPTKAPGTATFPFNRKFGPSPVVEGTYLEPHRLIHISPTSQKSRKFPLPHMHAVLVRLLPDVLPSRRSTLFLILMLSEEPPSCEGSL